MSRFNPALSEKWPEIRMICRASFWSSLAFSIGTTNLDGTTHLTPIGSMILERDAPRGFYFEIFATRLKQNVEANPNVSVLAINSSRWFWFSSLAKGQFDSSPAVRLYGTAGQRRIAEEHEKEQWLRRIRFLKPLKGYKMLWDNLNYIRPIEFYDFEWVKMGQMTAQLNQK